MLESSQAAYLTAINNVVSWAEYELDSGQVEEAINVVNDAAMGQVIGSETRQQVMKKAITQPSEKGIYGFVEPCRAALDAGGLHGHGRPDDVPQHDDRISES